MGLLFIAVLSGALLTYVYEGESCLSARLCAGAPTGIAALSMAALLLASVFGGVDQSVILLATAIALCPVFLLLRAGYRRRIHGEITAAVSAILHPSRTAVASAVLYGSLALVLWLVFQRAMFERAGEIYTGIVHNVGDLPFHLQTIASFAYGRNFPPEHPAYAGSRFVYPFLADFATAIWIRAGASLSNAMLAQSMLLSLSFVGLMHRFTWQLTRNRAAAALAPVLVLFSGGFGWWLLVHDIGASGQSIAAFLMHLPRNYTITTATTWRWPNSLTALLVTQRSLLLGLPLALCIFLQWWLSAADERSAYPIPAGRLRRMIAAGLLAGLLPLVHGHSFLVVTAVAAWLAMVSRNWRLWAAFFAVAAAVATPQIWWMSQSGAAHAQSFMGWSIGWDRAGENVLWFWLKNTGLFIPLLIAALFWSDRTGGHLVPDRAWQFYLPFVGCFVVPNLVRLAPWVWDNIKILFYWYLASVPLVALFLVWLWGKGRIQRSLAAACVLAMTLAGALDVWRVISGATEYREFDRDGVAMAEQIKRQVQPDARILHAPVYNPAVFLTGRRSLLGYPGTMWTHGLSYSERETDIRRIYAGASDASALLSRYHIDYVMVSPFERSYTIVNRPFFEHYRKVGESGGYRLYAIDSTR